jgi:hypothetical protein
MIFHFQPSQATRCVECTCGIGILVAKWRILSRAIEKIPLQQKLSQHVGDLLHNNVFKFKELMHFIQMVLQMLS